MKKIILASTLLISFLGGYTFQKNEIEIKTKIQEILGIQSNNNNNNEVTLAKKDLGIEEFRSEIQNTLFNGGKIKYIRKVPVDVLSDYYEIKVDGLNYLIHKDREFAIRGGGVIDIKKQEDITLTYDLKIQGMAAEKEILKLSEQHFITYAPTSDKIGTMYVFTDPTCSYCKQLHMQMEQYLDKGIEIKYIPYPRYGLNERNAAYQQVAASMCADDKKAAFHDFVTGRAGMKYFKEYNDECLELVFDNNKAGRAIQFSGTPFIYLDNGYALPGYKPAEYIQSLFN